MSEKNEEKKKFNFKKFFFDEETPTTEVKTENKPVTQTVSQPVVTTQSTIPVESVGVVNKETFNTLMKVLESRNLPGPDYLELKRAADAMINVINDENTRYISAYSVLKSGNPTLTKSVILSSIDEYLKFIESERVDAQNELKQIYDVEVGNRQKEIQKRVELINVNKQKIDELNAEILKVSQEINTINGEMLSKQTELSIQEKNFNVTVDAVVNGLNSDRIKLNTIIAE